MKAMAVAGVLCCLMVVPVLALKPAAPEVVASIAVSMEAVRNLKEDKKDGIDYFVQQIKNENEKGVNKDEATIAVYQEKIRQREYMRGVLCQQIIKKVERAYDIRPAQWAGQLVVDQFLNDAEANGQPRYKGDWAHWDPKFSDFKVEYDSKNAPVVRREALNTQGDSVTVDRELRPGADAEGITWPNGEVQIGLGAFGFGPGYLAAVIAHETRHFEQKTTPGVGDRLTNYDAEAGAFKVMDDNADAIFGLTQREKDEIAKNKGLELQWALTHRSAFYLSSSIPASQIFDNVEVPHPEPVKAAGEADFIGGLGNLDLATQDAVDAFSSQERQAQRQRLIEAKQHEQQLMNAGREPAAASCGFEELYRKWGDGARDGFRDRATNSRYYFRGNTPPDDGITKAAYLLMRACIQQTQMYFPAANGPVGEPCDDALAIMQSRWTERGFRGSLLLGTQEVWTDERDSTKQPPTSCVHYVAAALEAPIDMHRIRNVMQDYRNSVIAAQKEYARKYPAPSHEDPADPGGGNRPAPRNDPKPSPNPPGPHCWPGNEGGMSCVTPVN